MCTVRMYGTARGTGLPDVEGIPLVSICGRARSAVALRVKRAIDVAGATVGLILAAPLFLWAASSSGLLLFALRELAAATRRFDDFVRELSRFNERHITSRSRR